ncbi:MAG: AMP-binding protein [Hyphomicrobiales bacterium]|nr:AMP-binding protein [Hyphomicrobiales bacterium]
MTSYDHITPQFTTHALLEYNAEHFPLDIALREKNLGIWQATTWSEYRDNVAAIALALKQMDLGAHPAAAIIGDNRPEWLFAAIAVHASGGMSLGIYRDVLEEELFYLLDYAKSPIVFCEDEEQVDKFLNLEGRIPWVKHIFYDDPRGMRKYDDPRLRPLSDLLSRGRQIHAENPNAWPELIKEGDAERTAVLCTTSGTTLQPKLSMINHRALLLHSVSYLNNDPKDSDDEYVSSLPLPWIMEQMYGIGWNLVSRMKVNFVEEPEVTMHDLREIGPTFALFAPRVWEQLAGDVRARIMDSSWLKRKLYDIGMKLGLEAVEKGKRSLVAEYLLFRALRDRLGLSHMRSAATGGAALGPDTFKFFLAMGVPMRQLYGQTELLGAYTLHRPDDVDFDSVGVPFEGVELNIRNPDRDGLGEIVTRHPNMMQGYYKDPESTAENLDSEGRLLSGDAGYINEAGHLVVIDRVKDLATTSNRHRFSPQFIENKLKFSPYVAEAVILGHERPFLAAMICIRFTVLSKWAEKNRISFTTYSDLCTKPEIQDMVKKEVAIVNATLPEHQRINRFILLYKELDADDGELTRTKKVRRKTIAEKYADIINCLYSDAEAVDIDTTIHFQDGTSQRIVTLLKIIRMETARDKAA